MTQTTRQSFITSQTIAVEHIRISSGRPFAEVRRKLESSVPTLETGIAEALRSGSQKRAKEYEQNGPKLSIFGERDHGALLQIWGSRRNALQYDIGNPLTASKMTRHQLPAALYAPLRVVLFEDEQGRGIFEYDRPSSFFGQYDDERVTEVGRYLDVTLETVLRNASAGYARFRKISRLALALPLPPTAGLLDLHRHRQRFHAAAVAGAAPARAAGGRA